MRTVDPVNGQVMLSNKFLKVEKLKISIEDFNENFKISTNGEYIILDTDKDISIKVFKLDKEKGIYYLE